MSRNWATHATAAILTALATGGLSACGPLDAAIRSEPRVTVTVPVSGTAASGTEITNDSATPYSRPAPAATPGLTNTLMNTASATPVAPTNRQAAHRQTQAASTPVDTTAPTVTSARPDQTCPAPGQVIDRAPGEGRTVALTFDDGPSPDPTIRDVLRRHRVRATFFDVGNRSSEYASSQAQLVADGHLVAGHSWDHRYPSSVEWTVSHLRDQMRRTDGVLASAGRVDTCYFRPPGGFMDNVVEAATAEGKSVVLWSHDTRDWTQAGHLNQADVDSIVARATTQPGDHPIVLMHVGKADAGSGTDQGGVSGFRGNTAAALPRIIEWYKQRGYTFVDIAGGTGMTR